MEVLRLFSTGMSVTKIAAYTNRSVKTISTQKKQAMTKLGLDNDSAIYEYIKSLD
ncbi:LuxR C-terminal-related transcriptional regulator [Salinivibrio costicola]